MIPKLSQLFAGRKLVPAQGEIVRSYLQTPHAQDFDVVVTCCLERPASWFLTFGDLMVFKFGIAAKPGARYFNVQYGYHLEGLWLHMDVVHVAPARVCRH